MELVREGKISTMVEVIGEDIQEEAKLACRVCVVRGEVGGQGGDTQ